MKINFDGKDYEVIGEMNNERILRQGTYQIKEIKTDMNTQNIPKSSAQFIPDDNAEPKIKCSMYISEHEYNLVISGLRTQLQLHSRKQHELNEQINTLRKLREGDIEFYEKVRKENEELRNTVKSQSEIIAQEAKDKLKAHADIKRLEYKVKILKRCCERLKSK